MKYWPILHCSLASVQVNHVQQVSSFNSYSQINCSACLSIDCLRVSNNDNSVRKPLTEADLPPSLPRQHIHMHIYTRWQLALICHSYHPRSIRAACCLYRQCAVGSFEVRDCWRCHRCAWISRFAWIQMQSFAKIMTNADIGLGISRYAHLYPVCSESCCDYWSVSDQTCRMSSDRGGISVPLFSRVLVR